MCLPYVITSGFAAVFWTLVTFILPNIVVVAAIKIFFFYVLVLTFRYLGMKDDFLPNEEAEITMMVPMMIHKNVENV
jgi:hypothetical protein